MDTITTLDVSIPRLGFGTFRMPGGGCFSLSSKAPRSRSAIAISIPAAMYENQDAVGAADRRPAEGPALRHAALRDRLERADALALERTQLSGGMHARGNRDHRKGGRHRRPDALSTPEQDCIGFRSKNASMMPTRMSSSAGLSCGRQDWVGSSLGASALLRRERRLL